MNRLREAVEQGGSGPIVWICIIAATCLLLFLFQKILWLVVPLLIALILYYLLAPGMHRLVLGGMTRESASALVTAAFVVVATAGLVILFPFISAQTMSWEESLAHYLAGGSALLERTLLDLEQHFGWLAKAHVSERVAGGIREFTESFAQRHLASVLVTLATWVPSLLLVPFLVFFLLRDGRRFKRFLGRTVPNAFFERTLFLLHEVDRTSRAYFRGLISLTIIEAGLMAFGLWLIGMPAPAAFGVITAVLAWIPYVGPLVGGLIVVLVAATDFPAQPWVAYATIALFLLVRLLDDFVLLPLTIGRNLRIHPVVAILMLFVGGTIAGPAGLMLVLPLLGLVMVIGDTVGKIVTDSRLRARHAFAMQLRARRAGMDLG
jgi:predicted PurR-regulated permease PerM